MLDLSAKEFLTATRSARKRLNFDTQIERKRINDCLAIAFQASNSSNLNTCEWVVLDDKDRIAEVSTIYSAAMDDFVESLSSQAQYLTEHWNT